MSYNSYTEEFTHLNCIVHWFLFCSRRCATITTINFRIVSLPQNEIQYPLAITPYFFPNLQPQATTNLLYICTIWAFHIKRSYKEIIVSRFLLLSIMFTRFIHIVASISNFFLFIANIMLYVDIMFYLSIQQLMYIWIISTL